MPLLRLLLGTLARHHFRACGRGQAGGLSLRCCLLVGADAAAASGMEGCPVLVLVPVAAAAAAAAAAGVGRQQPPSMAAVPAEETRVPATLTFPAAAIATSAERAAVQKRAAGGASHVGSSSSSSSTSTSSWPRSGFGYGSGKVARPAPTTKKTTALGPSWCVRVSYRGAPG
jgi:hypothetical protein